MTHRILTADAREAKALHDGEATAVLRPMEPQPHPSTECSQNGCGWHWHSRNRDDHYMWHDTLEGLLRDAVDSCPHGRVGDVLLFKESHAFRQDFTPSSDIEKALNYMLLKSQYEGDIDDEWHRYGRWRPPSRMPRWAVRLKYPIASIEPIRVAEMTEEQAKALGVEPVPYKTIARLGGETHHKGYVYALSQLYENRHGEGSWGRDWAWFIGLGEATG